MSWWVILPLALAPIVLWTIGGLLKRVVTLENQIAPKIGCSFSQDDPGCVRSGIAIVGKDLAATYYRMKVVRLGTGAVEGCVGYLISIERNGKTVFEGETGALPFARSNEDAYSKRIDEGVPQYLDLVAVTTENEVRVKTREFIVPPDSFDEPGDYTLNIAVATPKGRPVHCDLVLHWTGYWSTTSMTYVPRKIP